MKIFIKWLASLSLLFLLAACNNESDGLPAQGGNGTDLGSLIVEPQNPSLSPGESINLVITNKEEDGSSEDITEQATITSSNPDVVSVGPNGELTGVSEGESEITISYGDLETVITVIVGPAKLNGLEVIPGSNTSVVGLEVQYTANALYSDGTKQEVTQDSDWTSSNTSVASISSPGLVKTLSAGESTINAEFSEQQAESALEVTSATISSIEVNPTVINNLVAGTTQPITVTAFLSDGTSQDVTKLLDWSSSDPSIATVDENGIVTGVAAGSAVITVATPADAGGQSKTIDVSVTNATVTQMSISPATVSLAKGTQKPLSVSANFSDGSKSTITDSVTWSSSHEGVATVDSKGLVKGIAKGESTVTATFAGKQATSNVTVTDAIITALTLTTMPESPVTIAKGGEVDVTVTATLSDSSTQDVTAQSTITSQDTSVATIIEDGKIFAKGVGSTQVTALLNGKTAPPIDITVTNATVTDLTFEPASMSLIAGTTGKFTATATFSDNTKRDVSDELTWQSDNTASVTVDPTGKVTAITTPGATITASYGGQSKPLTVSVDAATLSSIAVTPAGETIGVGQELQFKAEGTLSNNNTIDGTNDVTWSSSDTSIVQIGVNGLAEAIGQGTATITATFGAVEGTASIVVGPAVPQRLHLDFKSKGLNILGLIQISVGPGGELFTLIPELYYSDSSVQEPNSNEVQYMSSNEGLIEVDLEGNATLVSADVIGSSDITGIYTDVTTMNSIESDNIVSADCLTQVTLLFIGLGLSCDIESVDNPNVD